MTQRVLAITFLLCVCACLGPQPEVSGIRITSPQRLEDGYRVEAVVENKKGGEGSVNVTFRLKNEMGETFQAVRRIELKAKERAHVHADIVAPRGGAYQAEVEAKYPSR